MLISSEIRCVSLEILDIYCTLLNRIVLLNCIVLYCIEYQLNIKYYQQELNIKFYILISCRYWIHVSFLVSKSIFNVSLVLLRKVSQSLPIMTSILNLILSNKIVNIIITFSILDIITSIRLS